MNRTIEEDDDHALVAQVIAGSHDAFKRLVQKYQRLSAKVIARLVTDPEEVRDLNQECYLQVYRYLHTFRFDASLGTWIAQLAHSTACRHLRKQRAIPLPDEELQALLDGEEPDAGIVEALIHGQGAQHVRAALGQLNAAERGVLQMHYLEERSIADIAAALDMAIGTVKSHLSRGRARLRLVLAGSA